MLGCIVFSWGVFSFLLFVLLVCLFFPFPLSVGNINLSMFFSVQRGETSQVYCRIFCPIKYDSRLLHVMASLWQCLLPFFRRYKVCATNRTSKSLFVLLYDTTLSRSFIDIAFSLLQEFHSKLNFGKRQLTHRSFGACISLL